MTGRAVTFPASWSPERLAEFSRFQRTLQAEIDAGIGTNRHDPVKFHWRDGRFTDTFRDGETYTEMRDG